MASNTYFLSDLHLGAKYLKDPRANEMRVVRFLDSIAGDADALYLLGDILDYWYEYKTVVPRGYVRFLGQLARLADAGVRVHWLTGNHDVWLFDYLRDEVGMTVFKTHTVVQEQGRRLFISHGDDVGHQPPMYRFMRTCFYSPVCQCLYAAIHPRWTYAIATGWSQENRTRRDPVKQVQCVERSAQDLIEYSSGVAAAQPDIDAFIYGHLHLARQMSLNEGDQRQVVFLGDWITKCTYAVLNDGKLTLCKYKEPQKSSK